jgi:hypothetical protein
MTTEVNQQCSMRSAKVDVGEAAENGGHGRLLPNVGVQGRAACRRVP